MLRNMFRKTYTKIDTKYRPVSQEGEEPSIPEGLWRKCNKCGQPIYVEDVKNNYYVCPKCSGYFRVHAYRRIEMLTDVGTFEEWNKEMPFSNPLDFPNYEKKVEAAREKSGLNEAIVIGKAKIDGNPAVVGVCDARFIMSLSLIHISDYCFPNGACEIQAKVGAVNAACFDISSACTGFVFALSTAHAYISSGLYKRCV